MTSLKNRSAIFVVSSVLWQAIKCVILENLSTTTNIESLPFLGLGRPKMKSIEGVSYTVAKVWKSSFHPKWNHIKRRFLASVMTKRVTKGQTV
jgi:hypothetical protein